MRPRKRLIFGKRERAERVKIFRLINIEEKKNEKQIFGDMHGYRFDFKHVGLRRQTDSDNQFQRFKAKRRQFQHGYDKENSAAKTQHGFERLKET
jgi:hypothetical protein